MILVISGKSLSGKSTLAQHLAMHHGFAKIITCTTRQPMQHERNGVDYFFLTKKEFEEGIANDKFAEYAIHENEFYGLHKSELMVAVESPFDSVITTDPTARRKLVNYLRGNSLPFLSIHLDVSSAEQARRFVDRILLTDARDFEYVTNKLSSAIGREHSWLQDAIQSKDCDMIFNSFNDASDIKHVSKVVMEHVAKYNRALPKIA